MERPDLIGRLSELAGIVPEHYDIWGNKHAPPLETKEAILKAMGIEISEKGLEDLLDLPWKNLLEPVMAATVGPESLSVAACFPLQEGAEKDVSITWTLKGERGGAVRGSVKGVEPLGSRAIGGERYVRVFFKIFPPHDIGYYVLEVRVRTPMGEHKGSLMLIAAPETCYVPPGPHGRLWGLSVNLYGLRSEDNWAVGDLSDLKVLAEGMAGLGAGFIGLSPLHAMPNRMPFGISPYSPISRLYKNFIYIDIGSVPEFGETGLSKSPEFIRGLEAEKNKARLPDDLIDYEAAARLKEKALKAAFSVFYYKHYRPRTKRGREFRDYLLREGGLLQGFSLYMALAREHGSPDSRGWPEAHRSPDSPETKKFMKSRAKEALYHSYVQWLIDCGVKGAAEAASNAGMPVGLYQDLAVGTIKGGHEAWGFPGLFAPGIGVGAPADAFNPSGQEWGVMAFIPERMRRARYGPFIETIRKNMAHSGALRVDHALGLFRLFWVPEGSSPKDGAYVRYPYEEMLRIIALESVRNKAVIIAEDLGTITDEAREAIGRFGLLSYRLFYFEREWPRREFLPPHAYPERALAAVNTHDLPTLLGFYRGRDIELKDSLGLYPSEDARIRDMEEREADRRLLIETLKGFLTDDFSEENGQMAPEELCLRVYDFLASTPSILVSVSLDDVLEVKDQQNMPGTVGECPNWRRRYPLGIKEIVGDKMALALSEMFAKHSRSTRRR